MHADSNSMAHSPMTVLPREICRVCAMPRALRRDRGSLLICDTGMVATGSTQIVTAVTVRCIDIKALLTALYVEHIAPGPVRFNGPIM